MEQLNPLDAQFLGAEDAQPDVSMAIAAICVFDGPAPGYEEFLTAAAARLAAAPVYRRKLRQVPLGLGPPVWTDVPEVDIRYHVRQAALPAPGGDDQLGALVAEVMARRLDRAYPLWEFWLVEGLRKGRWAVIAKMHHSMADGLSGLGLAQIFLDLTPEPAPAGPPVATGEAGPAPAVLAGEAAAGLLARSGRAAIALGGALAHPAGALRMAGGTAHAAALLALRSGRPAPASSLSGPIGRSRRYAWVRVPLAAVKGVKNRLGGTVNDVVLAAITSGYRDLLISRGEEPTAHMMPSLIPVSTRTEGDANSYHNQYSLLIADLPVHIPDPVRRLAVIRSELSELKQSHATLAARSLVGLGDLMPYPLVSRLVRAGYRLPQRQIVTVTTNVRGPAQPLYCLGRRMRELIGYIPVADTLRTGVCVLSYGRQLTFAVTADYASVPDLDVLTEGIALGIAELRAAG